MCLGCCVENLGSLVLLAVGKDHSPSRAAAFVELVPELVCLDMTGQGSQAGKANWPLRDPVGDQQHSDLVVVRRKGLGPAVHTLGQQHHTGGSSVLQVSPQLSRSLEGTQYCSLVID